MRCALTLVLAVAPAWSQATAKKAAPRPVSPVQEAMATFIGAVETLRSQARGRSSENDAVEACDRIAASTSSLLEKSRARPASFTRSLRRLRSIVQEMRLDIVRGERVAVRQQLRTLQNSCVQCHVQHQDPKKSHELVPFDSNTLYGRVEALLKDGTAKKDRSSVVVFLDAVPGKWEPLATRSTISQKNRKFLPEVLPIVVGSEVAFPNDDLILHNVFSLSKTQPFDLDVYGPGKSKTVRFPRKGLVRVYCNIHPEMAAHVVVLGNPFFIKTEANGEWALTEIPNGTYDVRAWSRLGGHSVQRVKIDGTKAVEVRLTVQDKHARIAHKNKFGRAYRGKYAR